MTTLPPLSLLQAQGAQPAGGGWTFWVMIIAIFAIMYFFMIRPQNKKQKEIQKFRSSLAVGQEIVTIGGIYGTVRAIDETDNSITVEIASGVRVRFGPQRHPCPRARPVSPNAKTAPCVSCGRHIESSESACRRY